MGTFSESTEKVSYGLVGAAEEPAELLHPEAKLEARHRGKTTAGLLVLSASIC